MLRSLIFITLAVASRAQWEEDAGLANSLGHAAMISRRHGNPYAAMVEPEIKKLVAPFTRERLRGLAGELEAASREATVTLFADSIKLSILRFATGFDQRRYSDGAQGVRKVADSKVSITYSQLIGEHSRFPDAAQLQADVIARVKAMFPDATYQEDPLKTYLLIDFSVAP